MTQKPCASVAVLPLAGQNPEKWGASAWVPPPAGQNPEQSDVKCHTNFGPHLNKDGTKLERTLCVM